MSPIFRFGLPAALIVLAGLASSASAQTVKDGGFESAVSGGANSTTFYQTGSGFDPFWTVAGEVGIDNQDIYVFDGSQSLYLNSGIGTDSITQNIATNPTQFYTISFFANDDTPGDVLNVSFGGQSLNPITVAANGYGNGGTFTQYTFSGLTTANAFSALSFSSVGSLTSGTLELDDISVTSSPVPEASTSVSLGVLLMLGLGAVFAAKKKSASLAASL